MREMSIVVHHRTLVLTGLAAVDYVTLLFPSHGRKTPNMLWLNR